MNRDSLFKFIDEHAEINAKINELSEKIRLFFSASESTPKLRDNSIKLLKSNQKISIFKWRIAFIAIFFLLLNLVGRNNSAKNNVNTVLILHLLYFCHQITKEIEYKKILLEEKNSLTLESISAPKKRGDWLRAATNENVILIIESLTSSEIERPLKTLCLITKTIMTEPCCIEIKNGDSWKLLDGYFEHSELMNWLNSRNIVPQTGEAYSNEKYRVVTLSSDDPCSLEIENFMKKVMLNYTEMRSTPLTIPRKN